MKEKLYKAETRGEANHGWLQSRFSFSFAEYYEPSRIHFGLLRVLNDDTIAAGTGFGAHPHENMEIVTVVLKGEVLHRDNTGTVAGIKAGEVQIMSAGTGIVHSEHASKEGELQLLQIWVFPKERNVKPRYDQKKFDEKDKIGKFSTLVSPEKSDDSLWINQDAWFSIGKFDVDTNTRYAIKKPGNGVFVFIIEGGASVGTNMLGKRDALGVWDTTDFEINIGAGSEILLIDVPMN